MSDEKLTPDEIKRLLAGTNAGEPVNSDALSQDEVNQVLTAITGNAVKSDVLSQDDINQILKAIKRGKAEG